MGRQRKHHFVIGTLAGLQPGSGKQRVIPGGSDGGITRLSLKDADVHTRLREMRGLDVARDINACQGFPK